MGKRQFYDPWGRKDARLHLSPTETDVTDGQDVEGTFTVNGAVLCVCGKSNINRSAAAALCCLMLHDTIRTLLDSQSQRTGGF